MVMTVFMLVSTVVVFIMTPLAVFFLVMHMVRCVDVVIPTLRDKVHWSTAGVVFVAVSRPMFFVPGWDMEVEWLGRRSGNDHPGGYGNYRPGKQQLGRGSSAADGNLPVYPGDAHIDRNADVTSKCRGCRQESHETGNSAFRENEFGFVLHETSQIIAAK